MPKLKGVFDYFKNLDKIPIPEIAGWLGNSQEAHVLENFVGNRLLYPQTIPIEKSDLDVDLAILKAATFREPEVFFNPLVSRIIIPEEFKGRFPSLLDVTAALSEAIKPEGIITIYTKIQGRNYFLGTLVTGSLFNVPPNQPITAVINDAVVNLEAQSLNVLNYKDRHLRLKIPGQDEILVAGGDLGLMIDLRRMHG